ncbi:MAG TPA: glycosyltransferase [Nitrosopumilaceae archaeon]|nr:glycosyltransferase [Nitrosopumilaceae archaeon]
MSKILCVFPNDPLSAYYKKGEIKPRYFNPKNIFDEIHVISLFDSDEKEENVKNVAGEAKLKIHVVGKTTLLNVRSKKKEIINLIKEIKPDVIRSYNPLLQGWIAVHAGKELGIPTVISLMGDYDRDLRYFARKNHDIKSYLKLLFTRRTLESFAIKNADEVIIIYDFIRNYAKKMGAKNINLIYNRVDLTQFSPDTEPAFRESKPVVICVGRLMKEKNQECLIRAIKDLDIVLLLVGDGSQFNELIELTKKLGIQDKVKFERAIPHKDIHRYYAAADLFALPIKYGGFAIPVLEAAASGLPVILPKQEFDPNPELIKDFAMLVNNDPQSFRDAISKILSDNQLREKLIRIGLDTVKKISSEVMEEKEKELYMKLLEKN